MDDDFSILLRRSGLNMDQVRSTMSAMFPPKQKPIAVYRPHMVSTPQPTLRLPVDVIGVVTECLSGSYSYGTLAALNRTCKLIRAQTLPILFETVVWDNEYDGPQREWWWEPLQGRNGTVFEFPEGWQYIKVMYFEREQLRSWSLVATSHENVFPLLRFLIMRDLQYTYDESSKQNVHNARVTITTFLQSSVSFFISLFGTQSHVSILDMPLKVQQDYRSRNQSITPGIQYIEDLEAVHFAPKAFLPRSGRMSENLKLNQRHCFNGTHFGIGFQPAITPDNTSLVRETLEEVIILLPFERNRISFQLESYDPLLNTCVREAIINTLPRHFRSIDFLFKKPISVNELVIMLNSFASLFATHWSAVRHFTTPGVGFFSIAFETFVPNLASIRGEDCYMLEGGLWAQQTGFELMIHTSKNIPGKSDARFPRRHMHYKSYKGATNRAAAFEATTVLQNLNFLLDPRDVAWRMPNPLP